MGIYETIVIVTFIVTITAVVIVCVLCAFVHMHVDKIAEFKFNINGSKKSIYSWIKFK